MDTNRRLSDPRRAKTLHLREVRIIRHDTAPEAEGRGSNHTIRHGDVPMDALEEPGVPRQPDVERNYLEPRVLKGPQLGEGLLSAPSRQTALVTSATTTDGRTPRRSLRSAASLARVRERIRSSSVV